MKPFELVVVGASMGGLKAIQTILKGLPNDFQIALVMVQHRMTDSEERLVSLLQKNTPLVVSEPDDKEDITPGRIYLAPSDYHLLIDVGRFHLSADDMVCHSRPSIDVLFETAADAYRDRVVAVVLTGASSDGAYGAKRIKERGGMLIVQEPNSAENRTMPDAALKTANADRVLPLNQIAAYLADLTPHKIGANADG